MNASRASIADVALECLNNRLSVIPIRPGTKQAAVKWEPYQNQLMPPEGIKRLFTPGCNLALVCGKVSGGLECLDFDDPSLRGPFTSTLAAHNPELKQRLTCWQETPSGGFHLIYRFTGPALGNIKLAMGAKYEADGRPRQDVKIETRGEGGYFLTEPSQVDGKPYVFHGGLGAIPVITAAERDLLHAIARSFDEGGQDSRQGTTRPTTPTGDRPGDRYNAKTDWHPLLVSYGWRYLRTAGDREQWQRPGKDGDEASGTLNEQGFYCFSTSTPLPNQAPLDKFAVFTWYEHGGDFAAAARALGSSAPAVELTERAQDWPEPLPLIAHEQSTPYPLDALPETIGAAVREVVGFVQSPVALAACSALSVVSTVGQGLVDVRRAVKLEGPTSLYLLAVADSGERKTTVDNFFSKPVREWEAEQAEAAKSDIKRFHVDDEAWTAKKSGLLTAIKDAAKGGRDTDNLERNLADLETDKPQSPKVPRLLFGDATPEALAHRLAREWPVGGVLSSEAGSVFGSHGMKSDSAMRNMAMLNSLWGAEPLTIDRRSENGSFMLRGGRLSMGLAVQSETVRSFLDGSKGLARGIGWLARFLVAWPESTQGSRLYKDPPEHWPCLAIFHRRLGALLDHPLNFNDMGELEPETLELSPEAKSVWISFHDDIEAELNPGRDMAEARDVASKAADNAARLAGLFHLFENKPGGTISADHMRRAAVVTRWHLYEARRFMGEIALPAQLNSAAKLDSWLLEHCKQNRVEEISTRDIQRLGPNCTREKATLDAALQELIESWRVKIEEKKRSRLVKINPALLGG